MSITDANGALFTQRLGLGIDRVVVGRELSLGEIASVGSHSGVEIEAFVHGALCVSYSGQCFSSEAWGGRSANRGQCAQACRMPYGLIVNGSLVNLLDDVKYLLSPQDLCAIDLVPQLIAAGVKSFKIEGRLKGPEYVAITTKAYRLAVDDAWTKLLASQQTLEIESSELSQTPTPPEVAGTITSKIKSKIPVKTTAAATAAVLPSALSPLDEQLQQDLRQVFARGQDADHDGLSRCVHYLMHLPPSRPQALPSRHNHILSISIVNMISFFELLVLRPRSSIFFFVKLLYLHSLFLFFIFLLL